VHKIVLKQAQSLERTYNIEMPLFLKALVKTIPNLFPFFCAKDDNTNNQKYFFLP
jgi:hypothetical protein